MSSLSPKYSFSAHDESISPYYEWRNGSNETSSPDVHHNPSVESYALDIEQPTPKKCCGDRFISVIGKVGGAMTSLCVATAFKIVNIFKWNSNKPISQITAGSIGLSLQLLIECLPPAKRQKVNNFFTSWSTETFLLVTQIYLALNDKDLMGRSLTDNEKEIVYEIVLGFMTAFLVSRVAGDVFTLFRKSLLEDDSLLGGSNMVEKRAIVIDACSNPVVRSCAQISKIGIGAGLTGVSIYGIKSNPDSYMAQPILTIGLFLIGNGSFNFIAKVLNKKVEMLKTKYSSDCSEAAAGYEPDQPKILSILITSERVVKILGDFAIGGLLTYNRPACYFFIGGLLSTGRVISLAEFKQQLVPIVSDAEDRWTIEPSWQKAKYLFKKYMIGESWSERLKTLAVMGCSAWFIYGLSGSSSVAVNTAILSGFAGGFLGYSVTKVVERVDLKIAKPFWDWMHFNTLRYSKEIAVLAMAISSNMKVGKHALERYESDGNYLEAYLGGAVFEVLFLYALFNNRVQQDSKWFKNKSLLTPPLAGFLMSSYGFQIAKFKN